MGTHNLLTPSAYILFSLPPCCYWILPLKFSVPFWRNSSIIVHRGQSNWLFIYTEPLHCLKQFYPHFFILSCTTTLRKAEFAFLFPFCRWKSAFWVAPWELQGQVRTRILSTTLQPLKVPRQSSHYSQDRLWLAGWELNCSKSRNSSFYVVWGCVLWSLCRNKLSF